MVRLWGLMRYFMRYFMRGSLFAVVITLIAFVAIWAINATAWTYVIGYWIPEWDFPLMGGVFLTVVPYFGQIAVPLALLTWLFSVFV